MKNQYNRIYIFCTFRSQLILLVAFISINLFNVGNYAYTEGCGNLFGEAVGLAIKLQEDPTFIRQPTYLEKAYQLEQLNSARIANNLNPNPTIEIIHKAPLIVYEPTVVPIKQLYPLLKKDLDLDVAWAKKLEILIRNLCIIENIYTKSNPAIDYDTFIKDLNNLFVDYKIATRNDYEDIGLAKTTGLIEAHAYFTEHLRMLYLCSQGNPILLTL